MYKERIPYDCLVDATGTITLPIILSDKYAEMFRKKEKLSAVKKNKKILNSSIKITNTVRIYIRELRKA